MLPDWMKRNLRKREDGRDVIGITISYRTIKRIVKAIQKMRRKRHGR